MFYRSGWLRCVGLKCILFLVFISVSELFQGIPLGLCWLLSYAWCWLLTLGVIYCYILYIIYYYTHTYTLLYIIVLLYIIYYTLLSFRSMFLSFPPSLLSYLLFPFTPHSFPSNHLSSSIKDPSI